MDTYIIFQSILNFVFLTISIYLIVSNKKLAKEIEIQSQINERQQKELESYIDLVQKKVEEISYFDKF